MRESGIAGTAPSGYLKRVSERRAFTPNINPASIPAPPREVYALMGRDAIHRLIHDFYRELEVSTIRPMFPADMQESAERSAAFFVQLLGGPQEYNERYGNPRMRARHLPFAITEEARQVWLGCFAHPLENASEKYGFPKEHLESFRRFLEGFSRWMVNTES